MSNSSIQQNEEFPTICKTQNYDEIISILKEMKDERRRKRCPNGLNAISFAVQRRNEEEALSLLKLLIEIYEINLNEVDKNEQTCLFYAARDGKLFCCEYLINRGVKVDHADNCGQTAIFYASREGHVDTVRLLVKDGADINRIDMVNGETPLFYAAVFGRKKLVATMVQELGANAGVRNFAGKTAASMARRINSRSTSLLLEQETKKALLAASKASTSTKRGGAPSVLQDVEAKLLTTNDVCTDGVLSVKEEVGEAVDSRSDNENENRCNEKYEEDSMQWIEEVEMKDLSKSAAPQDVLLENGRRKKYMLQHREMDGQWVYPSMEQLQEFEHRFPQIAIWVKPSISTSENPSE